MTTYSAHQTCPPGEEHYPDDGDDHACPSCGVCVLCFGEGGDEGRWCDCPVGRAQLFEEESYWRALYRRESPQRDTDRARRDDEDAREALLEAADLARAAARDSA